MTQDRTTFQKLAEGRLAEARLLLENGQPSGAYYLAGYAIECALKARIAKGFRKDEIPELRRVQNIYTHDLNNLLRLADLEEDLDAEKKSNPDLYQRWEIVKTWSEGARYKVWTVEVASAIVDAIDGDGGILEWLRNRW
jgi:HEPN domain-containing protein